MDHTVYALVGVTCEHVHNWLEPHQPTSNVETQSSSSLHLSPTRWQSRLCCMSDLLGACFPSLALYEVLSSALSSQTQDAKVMDLFLRALKYGSTHHILQINTLNGSAHLSLLFLLATFASTNQKVIQNTANEDGSILNHQRMVKEKIGNFFGYESSSRQLAESLTTLEAAMAQGTSADMTHRALKLQSLLSSSFVNERSLAINHTRVSSSLSGHTEVLQDKIRRNTFELDEVLSNYKRVETERDRLSSALNNQRS